MSGGSDTTTVQNFPDWAIPYAQNFQNFAQTVANQPYQPYEGQTVAQLNPYQTAGFDAMAQRAMQGSPVSNAAAGSLTDTLSGKYLDQSTNPYLNGMIDLASQDVLRNFNNAQAANGSFGNSGLQQNTASQLGNVATTIRGNAYNQERQNMLSALGYAPSIANQDYIDAQQLINAGAGFQGQDQANLTDQYNRFLEARNYPQTQLQTLGRGLGLNWGSSTSVPSNDLAQGLGTGLALYGAYRGYGGGSSGGGK